MIIALVAVIVAVACAQALAFVDFNIPPETVSEFDPTAYMGRWYQMYTSLVPRLTFEKNGVCVVADYLNPVVADSSARFDIQNSENLGSPTGKLKQVCGRAVNDQLDDTPGEFKVSYGKMDSLFAGCYWIVRLGEIEQGQSLYPWAVVSVPFQTSLFILARDVGEFKEKYEADVLALVHELGYKYFFNKPLETVQSAECKYPPKPKPEPPKPEPPTPDPEPLHAAAQAELETISVAGAGAGAGARAEAGAEAQSVEPAEYAEVVEAVDELVEADFEENERHLRVLQRDPDKTKRPSSDKTKKPKPPSMRRTKQPNKSKQPKEPKSRPPSSAKPEPPPTPAKPEPPPTPSKVKPEPPPTGKIQPPPPPQKLEPPPPDNPKPPPPPGKPEPPPPPPPPLFEV